MENTMNGFTFFLHGKDYFVESSRVKKTRKLAENILPKINAPITDGNIDYLLYAMRKAKCEIKSLSDGRKFYDIHGDNFGGCGSFVDDGLTIILRME